MTNFNNPKKLLYHLSIRFSLLILYWFLFDSLSDGFFLSLFVCHLNINLELNGHTAEGSNAKKEI